MQNPIDTAKILREELIGVLGIYSQTPLVAGEIGTYIQPTPLTPVAAIFVGDRGLPAGSSIRVSDLQTAEPVPALEVIINSRPDYISIGRNFGTRIVDETWQIWLIFHDRRQNPRQAVNSILANFATAADFKYIPASNLMPEQYTISIARKTQLLMNT